jgi:ABC-2 type transport system ATP-binding protein
MLKANGVPVDMVWFCGGHGICLTNQGDPNLVQRLTLSWLNRWVKRNASVNTGARVDIIDQLGSRYTASDYPLPSTMSMSANGSGTLQLVGTGGAGPVVLPAGNTDPLGPFADKITPARATNAVNVTINAPAHPSLVVGAPEVTLTYHGSVAPGKTLTRVFAQLVDNESELVLGNQITPVDVTLDGQSHTTTVSLEVVAQALRPRHSLTLQIVATTVAYAKPRLGGTVTFERIHVTLPVARHLVPSG